jgi:methylaspartate mutase sigma subunit
MPFRIDAKRRKPHAILATTPSDSHTWNLLFIQLLMEENGWSVTNLGACVPVTRLLDESLRQVPDMIVISTVNGHGAQDASRLITALRTEPSLAGLPVYLGGKICVSADRERNAAAELAAAGYNAVLTGENAVPAFLSVLAQATTTPRPLAEQRA